MRRIKELFDRKPHNVLSIYYTAGFPNLNDTVRIAEALQDAGADMLEIGFPYSDPVADGPVIQASSKQAIDNGMTLPILFEQLKTLRETVHIPVLLMGYVNPVLQYGVERFCTSCKEAGIDGCIIPDLPLSEYERFYKSNFEESEVANIFLITPHTSVERIHRIDALTNGFIYLLSSSATTGKNLDVSERTEAYFSRITEMGLKNPLMIGFGISNRETFSTACSYANGAIIGTAFVREISSGLNTAQIDEFISEFK